MKRMFRAFPDAGIEFANTTVAVQTIRGGETAAAAAALETERKARAAIAATAQTDA
jgi:hypothetical protein